MFVSDKQWAWSPLPHCFITDMGVTLLCWERETRQVGLFVLEFFIYLIIYYLYIISVYLIILIVLFPTLCFPLMMLSELCLEWKICLCLDLQSHITFCLLFSLSFFEVLNALFAFLTSTEHWADFSRAVISNSWPITACVCFRLFFSIMLNLMTLFYLFFFLSTLEAIWESWCGPSWCVIECCSQCCPMKLEEHVLEEKIKFGVSLFWKSLVR